jgi:hypothetical protein
MPIGLAVGFIFKGIQSFFGHDIFLLADDLIKQKPLTKLGQG